MKSVCAELAIKNWNFKVIFSRLSSGINSEPLPAAKYQMMLFPRLKFMPTCAST